MIRPATVEDLPQLIALGREMHGESWYAYLPYDVEKVEMMLMHVMASGFLAVDDGGDGHIHGAMAGIITEFWFCREKIATDLGLFVRPGRRGSICAVRMVQAFIAWAKAVGAAEVNLDISTGVRIEETGKLYMALGMHHVGGVYKGRLH